MTPMFVRSLNGCSGNIDDNHLRTNSRVGNTIEILDMAYAAKLLLQPLGTEIPILRNQGHSAPWRCFL